jgi:hypothetical protein
MFFFSETHGLLLQLNPLIESWQWSEEIDFFYLKSGQVGKHFLELNPDRNVFVYTPILVYK